MGEKTVFVITLVYFVALVTTIALAARASRKQILQEEKERGE